MRARTVAVAVTSIVSVTLIVAVAVASLAACGPASPATAPGLAVVDRVVDGDTIDVEIGGRVERVRLIGIDTPEIEHAGTTERPGNPAECFADAAAARTIDLLSPGTEIVLARDQVGRDDYGRLLAYVYRTGDDLFVNLDLVANGYAVPLSIEPNTLFAADFVGAARAAEAAGSGLWGACATTP